MSSSSTTTRNNSSTSPTTVTDSNGSMDDGSSISSSSGIVNKTTDSWKYGLAGGISAFSTHAVLVPLDVIKTRIQIHPQQYNNGIISTLKTIAHSEGLKGLTLGFSSTAIGYFLQGSMKFGLFEVIKGAIMNSSMVGGKDRVLHGDLYHLQFPIYITSSALAEACATVVLCPWEAIRIKTVNQPLKFGTVNVFKGLTIIAKEEGLLNGYFRGLVPILAKQIPYTCVQLTCFSYATEYCYGTFLPQYMKMRKQDLTTAQQLDVSIGAGILAGLVSSLASHPADTLLSLVNKPGEQRSIVQIMKDIGMKGVWRGVVPRCLMVSFLSAGMFLMYDSSKLVLGLQTTGG